MREKQVKASTSNIGTSAISHFYTLIIIISKQSVTLLIEASCYTVAYHQNKVELQISCGYSLL